jgi:hypothetical protein
VLVQRLPANPEPPDPDNDGLTTAEEIALGTDPYNSDTDGDGVDDGMEVALGRNPKWNDGPGANVNLLVFTPLK